MKRILSATLFWLLVCLVPYAAEAASRFAVCSGTCTWDNTSTAMWCATDTGCTGASAPVAGDTVTLNTNTCVGGTTCTITGFAGTIAATSITMGTCTASTTGCILDFSANNTNVTVSSFISITGAGTRAINCGTGTFTLNGANTNVWDATTLTAATVTCSSANFVIGAPGALSGSQQFAGGGQSYGPLTVNSRTNATAVTISGANTFASVALNAPLQIGFPVGSNTTITAAYTWTGTAANPLRISANLLTSTVPTIVTTSGSTIAWAYLSNITFTGTQPTVTNSLDGRSVTGPTVNAPTVGSGGKIICGSNDNRRFAFRETGKVCG